MKMSALDRLVLWLLDEDRIPIFFLKLFVFFAVAGGLGLLMGRLIVGK
jgi:hypothetical protein